ncbi:MAG: hypothetical protein ACLPQ0_05310 [Candidatus Binatus sp.]
MSAGDPLGGLDPWILALGILLIVYAAVGFARDAIDTYRWRRDRRKRGYFHQTGRWPL